MTSRAKNWFAGLATAALVVAALSIPAADARAQERVTLQVLATSDLHMNLKDYDYYTDRPSQQIGAARVATLVRKARAANPNTILVDNGDTIQGAPMGDWALRAWREGRLAVHPMVSVFNAMGYDAVVLGNHEFNFGLDFLKWAYTGAKFPVLAGNVTTVGGPLGATLYPAFAILDREVVDAGGKRHRLKIGVLGVLTPQIMTWDKDKLEGKVDTRDLVDAAREIAPKLRAAGADVVIALSHAGLNPAPRTGGEENASAYLATVDGIDAVVTGHSHRVFPSDDFKGFPGADTQRGTIKGKPFVMPGSFGSHLGVLTLTLERTAKGWTVVEGRSEARPITERADNRTVSLAEPDKTVLDLLTTAHKETLAFVRQPVGKTTGRLHSYFAHIQDTPAMELVAEAQRAYARAALKGRPEADLPLLSAVAPFKAGGRPGVEYYTDIPTGEIAIRNVADLYVYPNQLAIVRATGAQIRDWLEMSARLFNRVKPGRPEPQALVDKRVPSYNFDVLDGLTYAIDVSQPQRFDQEGRLLDPKARRIIDLRYQGKPVTDDQVFLVATNNYRANGGGFFPGLDGGTVVYQSPDTVQQVIIDHIARTGTITPATDRTWRLAPVPGATVILESSPKAEALLAEVPGLSVAGPGENGFMTYRMDLSGGGR